MTPEELLTLRYQLPPFGEGAKPSKEMHAFCRFFGLEYAADNPGLQHLFGYVDSGRYRLATHLWRQDAAVANLLLVHGYYDHTGLFSKLIEWGLSQRCNVLIFDLPGHGLSSGEPAVIGDFAEYACAIKDVLARVWLPELPLWVMGQSTGCAALMEFTRHFDWPFQATVLLAPLVRPADWRKVSIAQRLLSPFVQSVPRKFSVNTGDETFLAFQQRDPLQCRTTPLAWLLALRDWLKRFEKQNLGVGPACIVQGDRDQTVDWQYNVPLVQTLFPGSVVVKVEGAGHQLANELPATRARYLHEVTRYLAAHDIALAQV